MLAATTALRLSTPFVGIRMVVVNLASPRPGPSSPTIKIPFFGQTNSLMDVPCISRAMQEGGNSLSAGPFDRGTRRTLPAEALTALGRKGWAASFDKMTFGIPKASALRISAPKFPGSPVGAASSMPEGV